MGVGGNQLHRTDVGADVVSLRLDAAAVQLHSQASQTHPCEETKESHVVRKCNEPARGNVKRMKEGRTLPSLTAKRARSTTMETARTLLLIIFFSSFSNTATTNTEDKEELLEGRPMKLEC